MSEVKCRGSFALGTACGKCSRCRREIESYNLIKTLRDKLNTPSSSLSRIEELEAKLAVAWDTQTVKILIKTAYKEGWVDGGDNVPLGSGWEKSRTKATLAELTGGKDE